MLKRRVLFLIDSLNCGGAEKSLISLLPLLDYSKIEVELMMVERGGVFEQYIPSWVHVVDFPKTGGFFFSCYLFYFKILLRLFPRRHTAELRWQAMASAYPSLAGEYDVAVAYQQGFPTYYIADKVNSRIKLAWVNADLQKVKYRVSYNSSFYEKFDHVIPVSDVLNRLIVQNGFVQERQLTTVYDILNVDVIKEMSCQQITLPHTARLRLVTVGRLVALKGYDLAVAAAHILRQNGVSFDWYFVGEGGMRPNLEQQIEALGLQNNVHLVGMVSNPYPYMAAADIYVQTSRFEGFGLTLNEARILHRPVISTDFTTVYNQIKDGENGIICEKTAESIAEKILLLANNPSLKEHIIAGTIEEDNSTVMTEPAKVMKLFMS